MTLFRLRQTRVRGLVMSVVLFGAGCTASRLPDTAAIAAREDAKSGPFDHLAPPPDTLPLAQVPVNDRAPIAGRGVEARLPGEERPELLGRFTVDYGSLPWISSEPVSSAALSTLSIASTPNAYRIDVSRDWLAQVSVGPFQFYSRVRPNAERENPSGTLCSSPESRPKDASWEAISLATWSETSLDYVRYEGAFDNQRCKATAKKAMRVKAKAIVPNALYAYRECVGRCADGGGEEVLVLIGPRSAWTTSSAPWPEEQLKKQDGLFTRVRVPMKKGTSAQVALNTSHANLRDFIAFHADVKDWSDTGGRLLAANRVVQLGFDALWVSQDPAPESFAFAASGSAGSRDFLESLGIKLAGY